MPPMSGRFLPPSPGRWGLVRATTARTCSRTSSSRGHMTMTGAVSIADPCPEIPEHFVDPIRIFKLARQIKGSVSVSVAEGECPDRPPELTRLWPRSLRPGHDCGPRWRPEAMPGDSGRSRRRRRTPGASRRRAVRRSSPMGRRPPGRPTSAGSEFTGAARFHPHAVLLVPGTCTAGPRALPPPAMGGRPRTSRGLPRP